MPNAPSSRNKPTRLAAGAKAQVCGRDAASRVPLERWDLEAPPAAALLAAAAATPPPRFGAFLPAGAAAAFDAAAFGIGAPEAALMDPQQRLLLEAAAEALAAGGGVAGGALGGAAVAGGGGSAFGAFVGISSMDYQKVVGRYGGPVTAFSATGMSLSVAAGRLAFTFGLRGPAVSVDTACSSSLVAAHSAALAVEAGQCGGAFVGGANLTLFPDTPAMFQRAGGDARPPGLVNATGSAWLLLPLVLALKLDTRRACSLRP